MKTPSYASRGIAHLRGVLCVLAMLALDLAFAPAARAQAGRPRFQLDLVQAPQEASPLEWHGYGNLLVSRPRKGRVLNGSALSNFDLNHLALWSRYRFSKDLFFLGELELEHGGEELDLETAFLQWSALQQAKPGTSAARRPAAEPGGTPLPGLSPGDLVALRVGKFIHPFGIERYAHAPTRNRLISRPLPMREILPGTYTDVGLMALAAPGPFLVELALTNGLAGPGRGDRQDRDNNRSLQSGGRLSLARPWGAMGVSGLAGEYDPADHLQLDLLGVDAELVHGATEVRGEWVGGKVEREAAAGGSYRRSGWYVQVARRWEPGWERLQDLDLVLRYDDSQPSPAGQDRSRRCSAGIGLAPRDGLRLKAEVLWSAGGDRRPAEQGFLLEVVAYW